MNDELIIDGRYVTTDDERFISSSNNTSYIGSLAKVGLFACAGAAIGGLAAGGALAVTTGAAVGAAASTLSDCCSVRIQIS